MADMNGVVFSLIGLDGVVKSLGDCRLGLGRPAAASVTGVPGSEGGRRGDDAWIRPGWSAGGRGRAGGTAAGCSCRGLLWAAGDCCCCGVWSSSSCCCCEASLFSRPWAPCSGTDCPLSLLASAGLSCTLEFSITGGRLDCKADEKFFFAFD